MFRTKTLIIITALMVSLLIPTVAFAESETITFGSAVVQDDQARNDAIVISMSGVTPAAEGSPYNAVLMSSDGTKSLNLGEVEVIQPIIQGVVQATGNINFTHDSSSEGYDGGDLLAAYSRIKITNGPGGATAYSDNIPANAAAYINVIMGELNTLDDHLNTALSNIAVARTSSDIDEIKTSVASAVADASAIAELADGLAVNAAAAAEVDVEDGNLAAGAAGLTASAGNIAAWVNAAKTTADNDVASQTSVNVATIFADKIFNELSAAKNGWDSNTDGTISSSANEGGSVQARASAQQMGTLSLEAKDLPGSETATVDVGDATTGGSVLGLGLPSVGEKLIGNLLLMGVAIGILMMGAGSLILVRNRT